MKYIKFYIMGKKTVQIPALNAQYASWSAHLGEPKLKAKNQEKKRGKKKEYWDFIIALNIDFNIKWCNSKQV